MTLDGMKWSVSKINSIKASMKDNEHFIDYVFPILRYHSRWNELSVNDFKYMFRQPDNIAHNGYYMRVDTKPAVNVPKGRMLTDYNFGDNAWKYLDKMRTLCEENDITLLLIKAPSLYPYWYEEYEQQVLDYANKYNLPYINFLKLTDKIGIDYSTDTYDAGLHMNLSGAEKLSDYIGNLLSDYWKVPNRKDEKLLSEIWNKKIELYEEDIQKQCEKFNIKLER